MGSLELGARLRLAGALIAACLLAALHTGAAAALGEPNLRDLRCIERCAGLREVAVDGLVRLRGDGLSSVDEVAFPAEAGEMSSAPERVEPQLVEVRVPAGAVSGRPRVEAADGATDTSPRRLEVVKPRRLPRGFELRDTSVRPGRAFFDQRGAIRFRYSFRAADPTGVRIELVRRSGGVVERWRHPTQLPFSSHRQRWRPLSGPDEGILRFRAGAFGRGSEGGGSFRLYPYIFPVRGSHGYGGFLQEFGAPRVGGRRHQGQDVYAACGTRLEAARGGTVQASAFHRPLYGHYVVIDIRGSSADHVYAHLREPSPLRAGDRVHTRQRIGEVGKTGNARTTPCHLHFEIWPRGRHNGSPVDPEPALRRWDGWS